MKSTKLLIFAAIVAVLSVITFRFAPVVAQAIWTPGGAVTVLPTLNADGGLPLSQRTTANLKSFTPAAAGELFWDSTLNLPTITTGTTAGAVARSAVAGTGLTAGGVWTTY